MQKTLAILLLFVVSFNLYAIETLDLSEISYKCSTNNPLFRYHMRPYYGVWHPDEKMVFKVEAGQFLIRYIDQNTKSSEVFSGDLTDVRLTSSHILFAGVTEGNKTLIISSERTSDTSRPATLFIDDRKLELLPCDHGTTTNF